MNAAFGLSVVALVVAFGQALPSNASWTRCANAIEAVTGDRFFAVVGHTLHSLTVSDLRRWFDPEATEQNYVPTINFDLHSDQGVLMHAPDLRGEDDDKFATGGMKTLDMVLSHMGEKDWDIKFFTPLERIVHAFHMQEVWAKSKVYFDRLQQEPLSQQVCDCALDTRANGIMKYLRLAAMAIREPALVYGQQGKAADAKGYTIYLPYTYNFKLKSDVNDPSRDQLDLNNLLRDENDAMPHLNDKNAWKTWKDISAKIPSSLDYNSAVFLHCAVRKSAKERKPKD